MLGICSYCPFKFAIYKIILEDKKK